MNTLYVFGCSYSETFSSSTYSDYINYLQSTPKSWSELLSENLNLKLHNTAEGGSSNNEIFEKVCKSVDLLKENDILIIQWSFLHRFRLAEEDGDGWQRLGVSSDVDYWPVEFINKIAMNKTKKVWKEEIYNFEKIINKLCEEIGCKVYYWYVGNDFIYDKVDIQNKSQYLLNDVKTNPLLHIQNLGEVPIEIETNGEVNDKHFGTSAHNKIFELFLNQIK